MQNLRADTSFDRKEVRASRYGAFNHFVQDSMRTNGIVSPDLMEKARRSNGRVLQTAVLDADSPISITNVRNVTISDQQATSQMYNFVFGTYAFEFTMVPVAHDNNEISYEREATHLMRQRLIALGAALDNGAITTLETNKSQVLNEDLGGKYTFAADTIVSTQALRDEFIGDLSPIMEGNDFYGNIHLIGNQSLQSHIRNRLLEQGQFNDRDKHYQYNDKAVHLTNRIANAAGQAVTFFTVEEGSCGVLFRSEREAMRGSIARTGHEWGEEIVPLLNIPMGTYFYESVGDYSAYNGASTADMKRVRKHHYGFAVDVAMFTAYNSNIAGKENPIFKCAISA